MSEHWTPEELRAYPSLLPEHISLKRLAGFGGYARVYEGWDDRLKLPVAIKVVRLAARAEVEGTSLAEVRAYARMSHPGILKMYDYFLDGDLMALELEWAAGGTLAERLHGGCPPPQQALQWLDELASALDHIHTKGHHHGDVKPSNVLLNRSGQVLLADFGLAGGAAAGTAPWMAPELWSGRPSGPPADMYALGVLAWELLTGQRPFNGSRDALRQQHLYQAPPDLSTLAPGLPPKITLTVAALLDKDPLSRPTAADVVLLSRERDLPRALVRRLAEGRRVYPGLGAFGPSDGATFFGRERVVEQLLSRLDASSPGGGRRLALVAPSGAGKTSTLLAGVVPALLRRAAPPQGEGSAPADTTGHSTLSTPPDPISTDGGGTHPPAPGPAEGAPPPRGACLPALLIVRPGPRPSAALAEVALTAQLDGVGLDRAIVVVDALEELLTLCEPPEERATFVRELVRLLREHDVTLLMSLRSDVLGQLGAVPGLVELLDGAIALLPPPDLLDLESAISRPALQMGLPFPQRLVDQLLREVDGRPGALPLLAFTLGVLWKEHLAGGDVVEQLRKMGGVGGALAHAAERAWLSLDLDAQGASRRLLLSLVTVEGTHLARRPRLCAELRLHEDPATTRAYEVFSGPGTRLLRVERSAAEAEEAEVVDVAHEALFEHWPRLKVWLEEERASLQVLTEAEHAAREWGEAGEVEGFLWRPPRLVALEEALRTSVVVSTEGVRRFALASRVATLEYDRLQARAAAEERNRRAARRRGLQFTAALGLGLLLFLFGAIRLRWQQADEEATRQRAALLVARSNTHLPTRPALSLALALRSWDRLPVVDALEAMARALLADRLIYTAEKSPGEDQTGITTTLSPGGQWFAECRSNGLLWVSAVGSTVPEKTQKVPCAFARWVDPTHVAIVRSDTTAYLLDLNAADQHSAEISCLADGSSEGGLGKKLQLTGHIGFSWLMYVNTRKRHSAEISCQLNGSLEGRYKEVLFAGHNDSAGLMDLGASPEHSAEISCWADGSSEGELGSRPQVRSNATAWDPDLQLMVLLLHGSDDLCLLDFKRARSVRISAPSPTDGLKLDGPGGRIYSAARDGALRSWDLLGQPLWVRHLGPGPLSGVETSPDHKELLVAGHDGFAWLTDVDARPKVQLRGHHGIVFGGAYSPSGAHLLTWSSDGTARLWGRDGAPGPVLQRGRGMVMTGVWLPDERSVVIGDVDGRVEHFDLQGNHLGTLFDGVHRVEAFQLAARGRLLYVEQRGSSAVLSLPLRRGTQLPVGRLIHARWRPGPAPGGEPQLLVIEEQGGAHLWTPGVEGVVTLAAGATTGEWSPDGEVVAVGTSYEVLLFGRDGGLRSRLPTSGEVKLLAWDNQSAAVATLTQEGELGIWGGDGQQICTLDVHREARAMAFSLDGDSMVVAGPLETLRVSVEGCRESVFISRRRIGSGVEPEMSSVVAPSPTGGWLLGYHGPVQTRPRGELRCVATAPSSTALTRERLSGIDSSSLVTDRTVTSSWDRRVQLWRTSDCRHLRTLEGHTDRVTDVRWLEPQDQILSLSRDGSARLWSLNGDLLQVFPLAASDGWLLDAGLLPEDQIGLVGESGRVVIWPLDPEQLRYQARQALASLASVVAEAQRLDDFDPSLRRAHTP